jgi:hypothetical protein
MSIGDSLIAGGLGGWLASRKVRESEIKGDLQN